jgi:hypothetical protein
MFYFSLNSKYLCDLIVSAKGCKDPNEEFRDCTGCEASCDNPNPICTADCKPAGCQCKSGYVRNKGKCILQENCPGNYLIVLSCTIFIYLEAYAEQWTAVGS